MVLNRIMSGTLLRNELKMKIYFERLYGQFPPEVTNPEMHVDYGLTDH